MRAALRTAAEHVAGVKFEGPSYVSPAGVPEPAGPEPVPAGNLAVDMPSVEAKKGSPAGASIPSATQGAQDEGPSAAADTGNELTAGGAPMTATAAAAAPHTHAPRLQTYGSEQSYDSGQAGAGEPAGPKDADPASQQHDDVIMLPVPRFESLLAQHASLDLVKALLLRHSLLFSLVPYVVLIACKDAALRTGLAVALAYSALHLLITCIMRHDGLKKVWPNTIDLTLLVVSAVLLGTSFEHRRETQRALNITLHGTLAVAMLLTLAMRSPWLAAHALDAWPRADVGGGRFRRAMYTASGWMAAVFGLLALLGLVPVLTGKYYGHHGINTIFNYVLPFTLLIIGLGGLYPLAGHTMQSTHAQAHGRLHGMLHGHVHEYQPPHLPAPRPPVPVGRGRRVDKGMDAAGIPADMPSMLALTGTGTV